MRSAIGGGAGSTMRWMMVSETAVIVCSIRFSGAFSSDLGCGGTLNDAGGIMGGDGG